MNNLQVITNDIQQCRTSFNAVRAGEGVNFDREAEFAIQVISNNDYLMQVAMNNRQSVIDAVNNVAAIGISLNPAKKQAYLVPRKKKVCLDISYIGLVDLAMESGSIKWAKAKLVRENDIFEENGFDKPPTHQYDSFATTEKRGKVIGVYVVVKTDSGDYLTETMTIDEVMEIRDGSEAYKAVMAKKASTCPWFTHEGEMIKKTVIKRAYKTWPKTDKLENAIHYLNTQGGEGTVFETQVVESDTFKSICNGLSEQETYDQLKVYWRTKNGLITDQKEHEKFKNAFVKRRNEVERENSTIVEVSTQVKNEIPELLRAVVADMEKSAQQGIDFLENSYHALSKATQEKVFAYYQEFKSIYSQKVAA